LIRLIDFVPDHAEELFAKSTSLATSDSKFTLRRWLENLERKDRAFTLMDNGHLIVSGGIHPIWKGMGEAWLIPSDEIKNHKIRMIKILRDHIDRITIEDDLRRLQATVRADYEPALRFIEFLGFKKEGLLKAYSPAGVDHYMYARVKE
tara:strand:- start:1954 stop:2400 length:447 start_codon:yes stop_codon:yes gene_type:complete